MAHQKRLTDELVRRGFAASTRESEGLIVAGRVTVAGAPAPNPSRWVRPDENIQLLDPPARFVSRGGEKLDGALDHLALDVTDCSVLDVGASTGGFTDCLLQRGARHVVAVDVGRGLLHRRLATDRRVTVVDDTNARFLTLEAVEGKPFDLVTIDVAFISLCKVLPPLRHLVKPGAALLPLVKPQFECSHEEATRHKGVIGSRDIWRRVINKIIDCAALHDLYVYDIVSSPIRGAKGNVEFFLCFTGKADADVSIDRRIEQALAQGQRLTGVR